MKYLFDFCAAEYEKRHGKKWVYDGGELIGSAKAGYTIWKENPDPYGMTYRYRMGNSRYWLERTLLDDVNGEYIWVGMPSRLQRSKVSDKQI